MDDAALYDLVRRVVNSQTASDAVTFIITRIDDLTAEDVIALMEKTVCGTVATMLADPVLAQRILKE